MKTPGAILLSTLVLFLGSAVSSLAAAKFYGATLSAALSTQSISGSNLSVTTAHLSNKSITNAIFATGTTGALKASDLALVMEVPLAIDVIDTSSSNKVISHLAVTGTDTSQAAVGISSKTYVTLTETETDFEFTLPGFPTVQKTNLRLTARINPATSTISKISVSFAGGNGTVNAGGTFMQGIFRQTSKVYP